MTEAEQRISPESGDLDLDFHIQFPTPEAAGDYYCPLPDEDNNRERMWPPSTVKDDDKEVVVVLLGWAGAQNKNLEKYSDIYLKRGCIVLRHITPVKILLLQTGKLPLQAYRLVRTIQGMGLDTHPIFFHVFSNGGSFIYSCLLREIERMKTKSSSDSSWKGLDIRGTIFDSAPSPRNLGTAYIAVKNMFGGRRVFRYVIASLVVLSIILKVFWAALKGAFTFCLFGEQLNASDDPLKYRLDPLRDWLMRLGSMRNHHYLFLYSDNDELVPWKLVEEFADIADRNNNVVLRKRFEGSAHVQHYRVYPEEYIETVTNFIRSTMRTKKAETVFWDYGV